MGAKGGRPRKIQGDRTPIHLLMSDEVLAGYDEWVELLRDMVPGGVGITRADVMRDILEQALREHQAETKTRAGRAPARRRRAQKRS